MKKNHLLMYQFPLQIQREYHHLMKTKESFSKNLSRAEHLKLVTLYAQLVDVWNQNHTEKLSKELDLKFQELREIQKELESDCKNFKQTIEKSFQEDLRREENQ